MQGETTWFHGRVTRKEAGAGAQVGIVHVDAQGINQRGQTTLTASAQVKLPRRSAP